jgi:UDP:flavonoid glycosyltransferase YjiC (YdhE family)
LSEKKSKQRKNMAKKILVIAMPHSGHINPLACVIHELKKQNQDSDIIFYGNLNNKNLIEATGSTFRKYEYYPAEKLDQNYFTGFGKNSLANLAYGLLDFSDKMLPILIRDIEAERPDIIIYDLLCLHAKYLIRSLQLRYEKGLSDYRPPKAVMFSTTFYQKAGIYPDMSEMKTMMNLNVWFFLHLICLFFLQFVFSIKHKLDIFNFIKIITNNDEELVIVTVYPELQPQLEQLERENIKFVGACISDNIRKFKIDNPKLDELINDFPIVNPRESTESENEGRKKLIFASLGTVFNNSMIVFENIIDGLKKLGNQDEIQSIVATGKEMYEKFQVKIKAGECEIPENILLIPFVNQLEVLKRASLFITHCGMNSTSEAILYSIPVICIPLQGDQPLVRLKISNFITNNSLRIISLIHF